MASYNPVVQIEAELRPCKVKGKNAFFHKWSYVSSIIPPSAMVGGHTGGTVSRTNVKDGAVWVIKRDKESEGR